MLPSPGKPRAQYPLRARRRPGRASVRRISPYPLDFLPLVCILSLIFSVPWHLTGTLGFAPFTSFFSSFWGMLFFEFFSLFTFIFFFDHLFDEELCFEYPFYEHEICINFSSIWGWIWVSLLTFFVIPFSVRVRKLLNLQNHCFYNEFE